MASEFPEPDFRSCDPDPLRGRTLIPADAQTPQTPQAAPKHIRCRDGAIYSDAVWMLPGDHAFVVLSDTRRVDGLDPYMAELVFWIGEDHPPHPDALKTLARFFDWSAEYPTVKHGRCITREIPQSDPPTMALSVSYYFELGGRPPRPTLYSGMERYAGRLSGIVYDFPATSADAAQIDMPPATEEEKP